MAANLNESSGGDEPINSINITPFVDVVLVLLVIFMVTAPTMMKDAIGINLPKAAKGDSKVAETFGVAVTKQGQFLLNGTAVTLESLGESAKQSVKSNPDTQAVISADQDARHGDVVKAIDAIKQSGLLKFAIQIQKE